MPSDTEARLEHFAELVATAIANAEARAELAASEARAHELAREQAALRRVATLVAEGASADDVFAAVAREVLELYGVPVVGVHRFEPDGTFTTMGKAGHTPFNVGSRWPVEDEGLPAMILASRRPARREDKTAMPAGVGDLMGDDVGGNSGRPDRGQWRGLGVHRLRGETGQTHPTRHRGPSRPLHRARSDCDRQRPGARAPRAASRGAGGAAGVATTVAGGSPPDQVFDQVAEEVGLLSGSR